MGARVLLVPVAVAALGACGGASASEPHSFAGDIRALALSGEPVYYAGESVDELALTHVDRGRPGHALFVYGECNGEGEGDSFICRGPQVQIQNWPLVDRHPSRFMLTPSQPAACRRETIRGVPVATFETSGGGLEVYAGDVVVVIFARPDLAARAADVLRRVGGRDSARDPLPPPPEGVARALRRCAINPTDAKLRELEQTASAPAYWVGRSFEGHPLARVEGEGEHARFVYGVCAKTEEFDSGTGCWPPLEIKIEPVADAHPGAYAASIECEWSDQRGALVATLASAHTLHVFTGRQTITLIGPDLSVLRRAVRELRTLDRTVGPGGPLSPPSPEIRRSLGDRCSAG